MTEQSAIYVVDDDEVVVSSVKALLCQHGYQVACYLSAGQFLAEVAVDHPGCVVTDVQMPDIDGLELQRRLLAANSPLSVVVVTGVADVPMAVTLMESGAVTLLEKPYDHADLLHAVERGLKTSQERWQQQQQEQSVRCHLATLTDEERHVMELMVAGKPSKAIAGGLNLAMRTVDRRRQAVLTKMRVKTVPELAHVLGATKTDDDDDDRATPPHSETDAPDFRPR